MVQLILQVLLIPVVFALHPENHGLQPEKFLKTLRDLNLSVYEYKIASVAREYKNNQQLQNMARHIIQSLSDLTLGRQNDDVEVTS